MSAPVATLPERRLWVYTNFDCNLQCSYCVAMSSPRAERRGLSRPIYDRLIDEAAATGVRDIFLTGGEPFLLPDIAERLNAAAERAQTTVLTNAMLFQGKRLERLEAVSRAVRFQVSLDAGTAGAHDAYRGAGAWQRAVDGIRLLQSLGFTVLIGSTETPANAGEIDRLSAFVERELAIPAERHFIRPLAKRGFSREGLELTAADLEPELTVSQDGVFWHPLALDEDMLLTRRIFPLAAAWELLDCRLQEVLATGALPQRFK